MADIIPPTPVGGQFGSYTWQDWYEKVRRAINNSSTISWSQITDFTGSNLTSLQTRLHNDLQSIQGSSTGTDRGHVPLGGAAGRILTKTTSTDYDYAWTAAAAVVPYGVSGRLTLESGVPVSSTDQSAKATIYFTPYKGNTIVLWDGSNWTEYTFIETSLAIGTLASATIPNDIFGYQSAGTLTLEKLAWTNATTRATAITIQDGRYCKSGDKTRLYLGSFYPSSTTTTEDSYGGVTTQVGGKRFLFNHYNQEFRSAAVKDTSASYNYSTSTFRQVNAAAGNKVGFMIGTVAHIDAVAQSYMSSSVACNVGVGVGIDNTSTTSAQVSGTGASASAGLSLFAHCRGVIGVGYHDIIWLEMGFGSGTQSWFNFSGVTDQIKTGLICSAFM